MPDAQPAAAAAEAQPAEKSWEDRLWSIGKQAAIIFAIQFAIKQFMGGSSNTTTPKPATPSVNTADGSQPIAAPVDYSLVPHTVYPMWPSDTIVDLSMYVSPSLILPGLGQMPAESLVVHETGFALDKAMKDSREIHTSFPVPRQVQDNGTLWAHIFVGKSGAVLDPADPEYDTSRAYRVYRPLTQMLPKRKVKKTRNLLSSTDAAAEDEIHAAEIEPVGSVSETASYYHPNFTLAFVTNTGPQQWAPMHPFVKQSYTLDPTNARDETGKNGYYYPILYLNTFWQLKSHMQELNSSNPIPRLDLNIKLSTLVNWQFGLLATMDGSMKDTARKAAQGESVPGGGDGSEFELIKETLLDTNPWLLGTTVIVTVLHMIFEMLAFKSDVGHWRSKKDNVGVSVRTILSNVVMQSIIFLYLMDNNENTSWMILFGQGVGIAIEFWKITKTVNVRIRPPGEDSRFHGTLAYVIVFEDKHVLSDTEAKTEEYDKIAFYWMGVGAVPLLLAYAGYSLVYESHKSWYSFIITTLVGSVYAYGFLMMIPSLYINYRLKSVAHMPAKAMTYKFLNTFIDDLFAFTIRMPLLHRLATLRDDVIFFVYLYQGWKYKVDYSRVNEFGQGGEEEKVGEKEKEKVEEKVGARSLEAPPGSAVDGEGRSAIGETAVSSGADKGGATRRKA